MLFMKTALAKWQRKRVSRRWTHWAGLHRERGERRGGEGRRAKRIGGGREVKQVGMREKEGGRGEGLRSGMRQLHLPHNRTD